MWCGGVRIKYHMTRQCIMAKKTTAGRRVIMEKKNNNVLH
jgi:hypothetical protein